MYLDLTAVRERAHRYLLAAAQAASQWYDADGNWVAPSEPSKARERFWICLAIYAVGEPAFADAIIRKSETTVFNGVVYDIFDNNLAASLLVQSRESMAADVRAKLEGLVRAGFAFKPGNRSPDYQFHGYNDNMPSLGTMGLILGGELLETPDVVIHGVWNLRRLRAMLTRRGTMSEFNSPTYTAIAITSLAAIAEHARDAEARTLALGIEERLWIDLAARFHPETGTIAGPYSRAYTVDTIGHLSCISSLLWLALGARSACSPMLLFAPPRDLVVHGLGDYPFNIAQMCEFAAAPLHIPERALALFAKKSYPFHAVATCEQGDWGVDFPARPCRIETAMHADFTVATASTTFAGGEHTLQYLATYRRKEKVETFRDQGTVFHKMVIDDEVPGTVVYAVDSQTGQRYANSGEHYMVASHCHTTAMQADATAMVLTHPHRALGGTPDEGFFPPKPPCAVSRISDMVIFPIHFGGAEEIIVGATPRVAWEGDTQHGEWIACRHGRLLIAIRPLAYSCTPGRQMRTTLERHNAYEVIRTTLYQGEPRLFSRRELGEICGGFIAEHASIDDYPSLEAFIASVSRASITDYFWTTRCVRYLRPADGIRPELDMEISWSTAGTAPRYATVNGQPLEQPITQIDGVNNAELPFLGETPAPIPPYFPWEDLTVAWGDWPSAIGDRGVPQITP